MDDNAGYDGIEGMEQQIEEEGEEDEEEQMDGEGEDEDGMIEIDEEELR